MFPQICSKKGLLFIAHRNEDEEPYDEIIVYNLVKRDNPQPPSLQNSIKINKRPTVLLLSSDCNTLAVAHENADDGLLRASVSFIRNILSDKPTVSNVLLDDVEGWDDDYLLNRGLNMPVTKKALEYWDEHSHMAGDLDFQDVRADYRPSVFLRPENIAWGNVEETELLINMQINNGLLRIDATEAKILDAVGYGLKDHSQVPIDLNPDDNKCDLRTYDHVFSMRNPDGITTMRYNGRLYVLTGNEGDDFEYRGFEFISEAQDVFNVSNAHVPLIQSRKNAIAAHLQGSSLAISNVHLGRKLYLKKHGDLQTLV